MERQIFIVSASIVDSNGTFNFLSGYPKTFDSKNYGGDVDKTRLRASGDFADAKGAMCKRDDRQLQTVTLETADGFQLEAWSYGAIAEEPEQEPAE